ncbi:hypothetical protein C8F01DRAFT_1259191 [Mycena amicta]|nr:hypothetical protein C8F01DRAFT_1259191 [Mycena amicta]
MDDDSAKPTIVRGARACTMKCVGADDGQKQCQRCKRANVECIFEKHRRGRKPGSKLSEASKMLRRLEKGLNSAKLKSHVAEPPHASAAGPPMTFPSNLRARWTTKTTQTPKTALALPRKAHSEREPAQFFLSNHPQSSRRPKLGALASTLIAAASKFFRPELYKSCQKLAHELAIRAFAEAWKRVEVDPDDNRAWTYNRLYSQACRMAVELGLNRYCATPPPNETEFQRLERRNRERTYLVLFTHDRSLSTQTGSLGCSRKMSWFVILPPGMKMRGTLHVQRTSLLRPSYSFASETTDMFYTKGGVPNGNHNDVNYEVVLRNCNGKLTQWMGHLAIRDAAAVSYSFYSHCTMRLMHRVSRRGNLPFIVSSVIFVSHVRLFLNSFGIQESMAPSAASLALPRISLMVHSRAELPPSLQALSACCTSALDSLQIVSKDFPSMSMLRYGQDSITVMSAYSAVFLLKLLRSSNTLGKLHEGAAHDIHSLISKTADAYYEASVLSPTSNLGCLPCPVPAKLVIQRHIQGPTTRLGPI